VKTKESLKKKSELIINLKRSWKYAKKNKRKFYTYVFLSAILMISGAFMPAIYAFQIINLTKGLLNEIFQVGLITLGIEIFRNIIVYSSRYLSQKFNKETLVLIVYDLLSETFKLKMKELDKNSSGLFIDRLKQDVTEIPRVFENLSNNLIDLVTHFGIFLAIFFINQYMFMFFLIAILIQWYFRKKRAEMRQKFRKEIKELNEKNTGLLSETIKGLRDIKSLGAENNLLFMIKNRFKESNEKEYVLTKKTLNFDNLVWMISSSTEFLLVMLGVFLLSRSLITATTFLIVFTYRYRVYSVVEYSAYILEQVKEYNLAANRVFSIIEENDFEKESFGTISLDKINGDIEFKDVNFSYGDNNIIKNMSFKINANETVSFVGKSGGGKTTIFSLITKLYQITDGKISIDGVDINELDKDSIRNNIALITQNPYIFNMTIKENLRIVKSDSTDEDIIEACKLASLHDYISTLKDGYDTIVGEGGVTLSGGQKQRLSIARALIKKTEVILFDEATSALDNETQLHIQNSIKAIKKDRTILIIAHRLSTVLDSDRIILIDDGRVLAEGTHEYLFNNNKVYKQLYEKEFK
jgi:ABC-type multidrug transport system fused ATPase/permease subunit